MAAASYAAPLQQPHSKYRTLSPKDAANYIVERRGYLFHNPTKRAREWSESIHKEMGDDAAFLASTTSRIVNLRLWPPGTFPPGSVVRDEAYHKLSEFMKNNP